jgi:hypothetical protein
LKLALWRRALARLRQAKQREASRGPGAGRGWLRRGADTVRAGFGRLGVSVPGALGALLKIGNIILGSLGSVGVPGVGAIDEFKKSVEEALGAL